MKASKDRIQRLARMLSPTSVALVGASPRPGTLGHDLVTTVASGAFAGDIWPVNPSYSEILGLECHSSLASLPRAPDLAIVGVAGHRVEAIVEEAVAVGVGGLVIFDSCRIAGDETNGLVERLRVRLAEAGMPVCGGNGMGFYNFELGLNATYVPPLERPPGGIALIAHSGSAFLTLVGNDQRFRFNLALSPGLELNFTVADYIDYALTLDSTKVIALFLETARDPARFTTALRRARERRVPVVALKVGRSKKAARMAATHSGALAGNDAAYQAVFRKYGVLTVDTPDELLATSYLISTTPRTRAGGLALVSDSGGLSELVVDLAEAKGVPLASFSPETVEKLQRRLPASHDAANPVDAGGSLGADYVSTFEDSLDLALQDPDTAIAAYEVVASDHGCYVPELVDVAARVARRNDKPVMMFTSLGPTENQKLASRLLEDRVALLNGAGTALSAIKSALLLRDLEAAPYLSTLDSLPCPDIDRQWEARLGTGQALSEHESLAFLDSLGIATVPRVLCRTCDEALAASEALGYPVVLKTGNPGVLHKTDVGGVKLGISTPEVLRTAYEELERSLGPVVLVSKMLKADAEIALGGIHDPQFGPLLMIAAGGVDAEILQDRICALCPVSEKEALELLMSLRIAPKFGGYRGRPPLNLAEAASIASLLSQALAKLGPKIAEMDINPLLLSSTNCVAVDALLIPRTVV